MKKKKVINEELIDAIEASDLDAEKENEEVLEGIDGEELNIDAEPSEDKAEDTEPEKQYKFKFTVITAVYNVEPFIEECIKSIVGPKGADEEYGSQSYR